VYVDALAPLTVSRAIGSWRLTPGVVLAAGAGGGYAYGVRAVRRRQERWPVGRTVAFAIGLLVLLVATAGWLQTWSRSLLWVYTAQVLVLLLVVPILLVFGRPVTLVRAARNRSRPLPAPLRLLSSPVVGPALIPIVTAAVFFTPLLDDSMRHVAVGWLVRIALVGIGVLFALPLAGEDGADALPLALALAAFVGLIELLADSVPGMVMRLRTHVLDPSWFGIGRHWGPSALSDQQTAGAILWSVAELLDLPFLIFIVYQWIKADARQAAAVDALLDARLDERTARRDDATQAREVTGAALVEPDPDRPGMDRPWWETDAGVLGERRSAQLRRAAEKRSRRD
jgi:putative copper resistance protein D